MRNSLAGKLKYLEENSSNGGSFLAETWTDETRELHPIIDKVGYNTQRKRVEYYVKVQDKWYYKWNDEIDLESPASVPNLFQDNFMTGWFENNIFIKLFEDNFDTQWREENIFIKIKEDNFQNNWYINNTFSQIFIENFESEDWLL